VTFDGAEAHIARWWCGAVPEEVIEIREFGGVISRISHCRPPTMTAL
jgi:hypothetical protein